MTRTAKGIEVHAQCLLNGHLFRETCRAKTEHELKQQFPSAYELHESLLKSSGYGEDRKWWRQFATKPEPATQPAANPS